MRSNLTHQFSQVPSANIQRSSFDRSHSYKTTFDAGYLVPVYLDEVLPGDTFHLRMTCFGRLATPLHPIMDNLYLDSFFFFCPLRLLWDNFQKFMGEQINPGDSTSYICPTITSPPGTGWVKGTMADFFGLPLNQINQTVGSFPFRAYNRIWNEWFRDQNLQQSIASSTGDGPDDPALYGTVQKRGKRHDYFTSALPWPQKGPAVQLPLGTTATVKTATSHLVSGPQNSMLVLRQDTGAAFGAGVQYSTGGAGTTFSGTATAAGGTIAGAYPSNLYADLTTATAATINQLRQAFQIQKIYERDARGGTRYTEIIQSHFGVTSPDARLQRPEYLGGGSSPVNVNPIAQTSSTASQPTPQGTLAAMGTVSVNGHGFSKSFTEHGILIGMVSVRADMSYQDGINRMWFRSTRFDFYWPALSHIGEQAILNKEIFSFPPNAGQDDTVWGYQERYAEYRYKPSIVTGLFRSNQVGTLDSWHLSQKYAALPPLNGAFIQENPPVARVIAVPSEPHFLLDCFFNLRCARPMPVYSVPGMIDHF